MPTKQSNYKVSKLWNNCCFWYINPFWLEGKFVLPGLSGQQAKFQGCTVVKQVASHLSGSQFDLKLDWKRQNLLLGADRNTPWLGRHVMHVLAMFMWVVTGFSVFLPPLKHMHVGGLATLDFLEVRISAVGWHLILGTLLPSVPRIGSDPDHYNAR